jgi:hypothetical protein
MSQSFCTNQLSPIKQALNFTFSVDGTWTSAGITPVLGTQRKFSLDTFQELSLPSSQQGLIDSTFTTVGNGGCQCDNLLLEAHYTVSFE